MSRYKIILSGGGTGGHIFPAIAIANELRRRFPEAEILFVGAEDRMEMECVPAAGYRIIGLPVKGFNRTQWLKNFDLVVKLFKSLRMAGKLLRDFKPDIAIGVGGYASAPTLCAAYRLRIPVLIQEQNSFAGITNRLLGRQAAGICVAYRGMNKFFPEERIVITGNPVRKEIETTDTKAPEALDYFHLEAGAPVLLIVGGSLGARTINHSVQKGLHTLLEAGIRVIWQTGRAYYASIREQLAGKEYEGLWLSDFIRRMDLAYAAADLVVSRAGAGTISELSLMRKPAILVPSPNVAENHQMKNARALSDNKAAVLIPDDRTEEQLIPTAIRLLGTDEQLHYLSENIALFAQHRSTERIVDEVVKIMNTRI